MSGSTNDTPRACAQGHLDGRHVTAPTRTVAALYVQTGGAYFGLPDVDPWDEPRDARRYAGPWPVVAHPPCQRWGRYWSGGPSHAGTRLLGDDDGCFDRALWAVRQFGGVLEHPEASHAWGYYDLAKPPRAGGWVEADAYGGWTCCVEQGHYGHRARKATWLYACAPVLPDLVWGPSAASVRLDPEYHSTAERRAASRAAFGRLSKTERAATPTAFRDVLLELARSAARSRRSTGNGEAMSNVLDDGNSAAEGCWN